MSRKSGSLSKRLMHWVPCESFGFASVPIGIMGSFTPVPLVEVPPVIQATGIPVKSCLIDRIVGHVTVTNIGSFNVGPNAGLVGSVHCGLYIGVQDANTVTGYQIQDPTNPDDVATEWIYRDVFPAFVPSIGDPASSSVSIRFCLDLHRNITLSAGRAILMSLVGDTAVGSLLVSGLYLRFRLGLLS